MSRRLPQQPGRPTLVRCASCERLLGAVLPGADLVDFAQRLRRTCRCEHKPDRSAAYFLTVEAV